MKSRCKKMSIILFCFSLAQANPQTHSPSISGLIQRIKNNRKIIFICGASVLVGAYFLWLSNKKNNLQMGNQSALGTQHEIDDKKKLTDQPSLSSLNSTAVRNESEDESNITLSSSISMQSMPRKRFSPRLESLTPQTATNLEKIIEHVRSLSPDNQERISQDLLRRIGSGISEERLQS